MRLAGPGVNRGVLNTPPTCMNATSLLGKCLKRQTDRAMDPRISVCEANTRRPVLIALCRAQPRSPLARGKQSLCPAPRTPAWSITSKLNVDADEPIGRCPKLVCAVLGNVASPSLPDIHQVQRSVPRQRGPVVPWQQQGRTKACTAPRGDILYSALVRDHGGELICKAEDCACELRLRRIIA